ncbi:MAG: LytR family transcriptional regulator [Elusimicrobia bacterium]|nr:MAG: LytR family transcriptional regulator [Elusimicrobiota bacterium]
MEPPRGGKHVKGKIWAGDRAGRWVGGFGLLTVAGLSLAATVSPVAGALRRGEPVSGVALGTDLAENAPHSDTLLAWVVRPRRGRVDVLSIPRDTRVDIPGYRFRRINEVYAYHHRTQKDALSAAAQTRNAVEHLFRDAGGTLPLRNVVQIDYNGFRRLIDRLGGVTVAIDEPMDYDDDAGGFHVHFATGARRLDGNDALGFVRFRGRSGDRGRVLRQMEFVRALVRRAASPDIVGRGPLALMDALGAVTTNLSLLDLAFLGFEARRWTPGAVHPWILPGKPKGAYWEMDRERTAYVLRQLADDNAPAAPDEGVGFNPEATTGPAPTAGARATVKVWNATSRGGLALRVARRLREEGFDVVEWGNYNGRQAKSRVIDRSGRFDSARGVVEVLGVGSLYSDTDPALRTDVEVILGEDAAARWGAAEETSNGHD